MPLTTPPPTAEERAALARFAGLCAACGNAQALRSRRSLFLRCALSDRDPRFPRYPPLPVHRCAGFRAAPPPGGDETPAVSR